MLSPVRRPPWTAWAPQRRPERGRGEDRVVQGLFELVG